MTRNLDFGIDKFKTYEEYVESKLNFKRDYRYLSSTTMARNMAMQGYRTKVYTADEFYKMKALIYETVNPKAVSLQLYGRYCNINDDVLAALAAREEPNLLYKMSTIIFMQVKKRDGFEISGYIDYEQSLRECSLQVAEYTDWQAVFEGRKLLRPKPTDLSFYDWHKGVILHTDSANWQSVLYLKDLKFMNKLDLKIIPVTTRKSKFSINVTRSVFKSKLYESIVLYDHVL